MKRLALSLMTLACLPTVAAAAPVDPAHVSADAQWFLHLDIEAIGDMEIVQQWKAKIETKDRYKKMAERASEKLGMNPAEDLLGVTIYADKYEGETGVVLIYVQNVDREKMNELFNEKHPDHKTTKYGKRTIATWTAKHKHKEKEVSGTFASDGVILLASSVSEAKAALDVIDGKAKGLGEDSELLADVAKNPLLVSRAIDVPKDYRGLTKCPVLRLCTDAFAQWTADDGEIMGHYVLKAESPDIAENFKTIVVSRQCHSIAMRDQPAALRIDIVFLL